MNRKFLLSCFFVFVSLMLVVGCESKKMVKLETSMGDIVIEFNEEKAPITVKNFLEYVNEGYYDGTIFHRVISDFMIQGGGFDTNLVEKTTHDPIKNESENGLENARGTVAMARTPYPDSATSQFFINHVDNKALNYSPSNPGYAVFGKVVEGMDVVDAIAGVKTTTKVATTRAGKAPFQNVPVENVVISSAKIVSNN